jgi:hypothetical protein
MMTVIDYLRERRNSILERWLERALALYAPDASNFFAREKNAFANPVGSTLREGASVILDNLIDEFDAGCVCGHLEEIIKIRAVQDFSPSRAVSFVFLLKDAIRSELRDVDLDRHAQDELARIDAAIDQTALFAFDIYVKCREQVYELRVDEVKRNVSAIMKRFTGNDADTESAKDPLGKKASSQGGGV